MRANWSPLEEREAVPVEEAEVAEFEVGDDEEGHEGQGHEGGGEGGTELFGEAVDGGIFFGDLMAFVGTHEAGDGEGEDHFRGGGFNCGEFAIIGGWSGVDAGEAAVVGDHEVDGAADAVVVNTDGYDIVTVMGNRRREGAAFEAEAPDEGLGDGAVGLVAVDDDNLEEVFFGAGVEAGV